MKTKRIRFARQKPAQDARQMELRWWQEMMVALKPPTLLPGIRAITFDLNTHCFMVDLADDQDGPCEWIEAEDLGSYLRAHGYQRWPCGRLRRP